MSVRLHLKWIKVLEVVVDDPFELKIVVADSRSVVRCPSCGHKTAKVHDTRDVVVRDVDFGGRPTTLVWRRRRFVCERCGERHLEDHPEIEGNVTARLARSLERDARAMSIREVARRSRFSLVDWHFIMGLVRAEVPVLPADYAALSPIRYRSDLGQSLHLRHTDPRVDTGPGGTLAPPRDRMRHSHGIRLRVLTRRHRRLHFRAELVVVCVHHASRFGWGVHRRPLRRRRRIDHRRHRCPDRQPRFVHDCASGARRRRRFGRGRRVEHPVLRSTAVRRVG